MTSHLCARCGLQNPLTVWQCYQCGAALNSIDKYSIWRKDSVLVMSRQALLPDRCIKCNEPAERKLKRKLSWHHPAIYLLIFVGALVYVVLAMIMRKSATIEVGLCENHSAIRTRDIMIAWTLGLLSIASILLAARLEDLTFVAIAGVLIIACAIYGVVRVKVVTPTRIDENFIWLKGCNPRYLTAFPQWRG